MSAATDLQPVDRAEWADVRDYFADQFELGDHVAIAGATGEGKTETMLQLLREIAKRETVQGWPVAITAFEVKRRDTTMQKLLTSGEFRRIRTLKEWPPHLAEARTVVWPAMGSAGTRGRQLAKLFGPILDEIERSGNQIVFVDEAAYFERPQPNGLGLGRFMENYWTTQRSNGVSLVAATQRPVRVSRSMWSEPSWLFIFALEDEDDLKTVASRSVGYKAEILATVPTLAEHEFIMIRRRPRSERMIVVSKAEL